MKTLLTIFLTIGMLHVCLAQTVRRVNPDTKVTGTNVYNTLQDAHDAAANGDIIIVEPGNSTSTTTSVGDLISFKRLTIYGSGYYREYNTSYSQLVDNSYSSQVGDITLSGGSQQSTLKGLKVVSVTIQTSNISVSGCSFQGNTVNINIDASSGNIGNININQNHLSATYGYSYPIYLTNYTSNTISSVTVANNLIGYSNYEPIYYSYGGIYISNLSNLIVNNNTFFNSLVTLTSYSTIWTNNIFLNGGISASATIVNSTFNNNVFAGTISGIVGSNNQTVVNLSTQFKANTSGSPDNNYQVANGSVLKTASMTGGEVGMFGGTTPYILGGLPVGPSVIKISNTGIGNNTNPITTTFSAISNK